MPNDKRYIDADEYECYLEKHMYITENRQKKHGFRDAINMIDEFVVDVAPVVHGEWVFDENGMDFGIGAWVCGVCGVRNNNIGISPRTNPSDWSGSKYCPNCGAKMDKKQFQTEKSENL